MKKILFILICFSLSCKSESKQIVKDATIESEMVHTMYSTSSNEYLNFNSVAAINRIADIENEYFKDIEEDVSRYYGTIWRQRAEEIMLNDSTSSYQNYLNQLTVKPDSLHCTIYAYEGLKAGFTTEQVNEIEQIHRDIWKGRERAGWSVGYILVKYFNWKAYLILDSNSNEYEHCMKSFERDKSYPVWKQPNIPLEQVFIVGKDDSAIEKLLLQHEFSWGFSEQGIHTWITRYNKLKECNWLGSPSQKFKENEYEKPLFLMTDFEDYFDYNSHVIIVPKKKESVDNYSN